MSSIRGFSGATRAIIVCSYRAGSIGYAAILRNIGARYGTLHAAIELRYRKIGSSIVIILREGSTIPMRLCGEGGANAENDGKRKDGRFDFFHTKLFLFCLVDDMVLKRFLD